MYSAISRQHLQLSKEMQFKFYQMSQEENKYLQVSYSIRNKMEWYKTSYHKIPADWKSQDIK